MDTYSVTMQGERLRRVERAGLRVEQRGRLQWLLAQLDRKLEEPGEIQDLANQLLGLIGAAAPDNGHLLDEKLGAAELRHLFGYVRGALEALWGEGVVRPWKLPDEYQLTLEVTEMTVSKEDAGYAAPGRVELVAAPVKRTVRSLFLGIAVREIQAAAPLIRHCRWDGVWFVRTTSQQFCSARCTQKAMNAGKTGRRKKPPFVPKKPTKKPTKKRRRPTAR